MTENRIHWADAARGMAIVLVALHHAVIYAGTFNLGNDVWIGVTEVLRTMRMPLFFMAAGLFAVKWVSADWRALFRSKLMLLGWVFALWVVIRWLWMNSIPGADSETGVRQLVLHMVWPLGGWFLFTLAALFVLARATLKIAPAAQLIAAGLLSAAWFSIDGGNLIGNNAYDGIPSFYFFFLLGVYGRSAILRATERLTPLTAVTVVIVWGAAATVLELLSAAELPVVAFILRVMGLAAGVSIAIGIQGWGWLRHLGSRTLSVYVSHSLFIYATLWAASVWVPVNSTTGWVLPPLVAAVGLGLGYLAGEAAPKIGAGWLFAPPRWLGDAADQIWPASAGPQSPNQPIRADPS